jgi:DNA-binding MarR family transcriptional regulator
MKPFTESRKTLVSQIMNMMRHVGETFDYTLSVNNVPLAGDQLPLLMLSAQFEGHSMKDLANIIKRDKAGILRGLRSFEKRGLIRFQGEATDKRKRLVYLTPLGHAMMKQIMKYLDVVEKQIKNGITPDEFNGFYKIINKINANCIKILGEESKIIHGLNFDDHLKLNTAKRR